MWVGVIILLHTAVHMSAGDPFVEDAVGHINQVWIWLVAMVLTAGFYLYVRQKFGRGNVPPREVLPTS